MIHREYRYERSVIKAEYFREHIQIPSKKGIIKTCARREAAYIRILGIEGIEEVCHQSQFEIRIEGKAEMVNPLFGILKGRAVCVQTLGTELVPVPIRRTQCRHRHFQGNPPAQRRKA